MSSPVDPRRKGEVFANDDWFRWPVPCRTCEGLPERRSAERRSGYESLRAKKARGVERRWHERRKSAEGGQFALRITWGLIDGSVECIGVEVWRDAQPDPADRHHAKWVAHRGATGPAPIRTLKDVALDNAIRHRRHVLMESAEKWETFRAALTSRKKMAAYGPLPTDYVEMVDEQSRAFGARDVAGSPAGLRRGRQRRSDDELRKVALAYLAAKGSRTAAVQELLNLRDPRSVNKVLVRCAERGILLPPEGPGKPYRAGPRLSPEATKPGDKRAAQRPTDRTTKKGR